MEDIKVGDSNIKYNPVDDYIYINDGTEWIQWKESGLGWDGVIYDGINFFEGVSKFTTVSGNFSISGGKFSASDGGYASQGSTRTFNPSGVIGLDQNIPTKNKKYLYIFATYTAATGDEDGKNVPTSIVVTLTCTATDTVDTTQSISGSMSNEGISKLKLDVSTLSDMITLQLKPSATLSHYHNSPGRVEYLTESCSITITKIMFSNE